MTPTFWATVALVALLAFMSDKIGALRGELSRLHDQLDEANRSLSDLEGLVREIQGDVASIRNPSSGWGDED